MVKCQIAARGVRDGRVLDAMRRVPREAFVAEGSQEFAHEDSPLPIGEGQTISQPYIVAFMLEAAEIGPGERVLEVGAGSGYAAAVAAQLAAEVCAVERHDSLVGRAQQRFDRLGYRNIILRHADGTKGWPDDGGFGAIVVSAGGAQIPPALKSQLRIGGRLVIPVGAEDEPQDRVDRSQARHEPLMPIAVMLSALVKRSYASVSGQATSRSFAVSSRRCTRAFGQTR
jgi:protein-L-isoaspartate(D-aspartate) O-methyltransferase